MRLIRNLLTTLTVLVLASPADAQDPDWSVNPQAYQYSMTLVAFLSVDHSVLQNGEDKVAAFINGEVRGVASPIYIESAQRYLAYLTVYANRDMETVGFKLYESAAGRIVDIALTLPFKIDGQQGSSFQALSLANPALNGDADIQNFFFEGVDSVSTAITDGSIDIVLEYDQDLSSLTPAFTLSDGARLYQNRALVEPGAATYDFSQPVTYSVLSEDERTLKTWAVSVRNREISSSGFVSANVITANNDGANDYWIVKDVFKYKDRSFRIFDANGRIVYESVGYNNDWDGTYHGDKLARGKYHFVVSDPETGTDIHGSILVLY